MLLGLAAGLALGAIAATGADTRRGAGVAPPLTRATGGLGLGASASVAWSFFGFDPRLESSCENELWPLPGLDCPNPAHGAGIVDLPPRDGWLLGGGGGPAPPADD